MIFNKFFPDMYVKSIYEIPFNELKRKGIKLLVFDIDNTLIPFDIPKADEKLIKFFKYLKKQGFKLSILSNNNKQRIELFNKDLGTLAVYKANKPGIKKINLVMKKFGVNSYETAMIGDQIFTDIFCGNRVGAFSILTIPVSDRDQFITKIKRGIEKYILNIYLKTRL